MTATEIKTGKFYVKETLGLVCEIIQEKGNQVYWQGYDLATRLPIWGLSICSKHQVSRWPDREATAEEVARLQGEATHRRNIEG